MSNNYVNESFHELIGERMEMLVKKWMNSTINEQMREWLRTLAYKLVVVVRITLQVITL